MGTNYYLQPPACDKCGKADDSFHIGKSSAGWCFSLHVMPEHGIRSLEDWIHTWDVLCPTWKIVDEYGEEVTREQMLDRIRDRGRPDPIGEFNYDANHAEPGPNNLIRHRIGRYCIGHGEGTWDLIPGEFS